MAKEAQQFVARESDVGFLQDQWAAVSGGSTRIVRLQAPFGGGRRAVVGEFMRGVSQGDSPPLIWRVVCLEQENGMQWLVRMYGSLMATISSNVIQRGKVEMMLNSQLPSQPPRVQNWYQEFIAGLKEAKPNQENGSISLRMPRDNPLLGLVEVVAGLGRKQPIVLDLQNATAVHSLALAQFLECLLHEGTERGVQVMVIVHDDEESDATKATSPLPLLDFFERAAAPEGAGSGLVSRALEPWGAEEVQQFLDTRELGGNAARLAEIAGGRPGFVAELIDVLAQREMSDSDLTDVTFASLTPIEADASKITEQEGEAAEGQSRPATAADAKRIAFLGALLGQGFPSGLVADMAGFTRDSVDDVVDSLGELLEEMQFSNELGTWIYRFKRGAWREGVLEMHQDEESQQVALRVGVFMERFLVPRGYGFMSKTSKIYAEAKAYRRAAVMRSILLSNDAPDMWGLAFDTMAHFDEVAWPDQLRRTVYMNLLDRLIVNGAVETVERVHTEATEWAAKTEDREMTAWLLLAGSRLDARRQDFYRARDRAQDALRLYTAMENKNRAAEVQNHLASVELQDGNPNAALAAVDEALALAIVEGENGEKVVPPNVFATAEQIRGLVARRSGQIDDAIGHFQKANEAAGTTGLAQLALDSGLSYSEALLATGRTKEGRDALSRVVDIAAQLQNPVRERNARELLAQAEGSLQNFDAAVQHATRVLDLTRNLKFERALPVDLYNVGFFLYASGKPSEAITYFRQAQQGVGALGEHPVVKELWYWQAMAYMRTNQPAEARDSFRKALRPLQKANDTGKMISAMDRLASIEHQQGNTKVAQKLLADAVRFALKGQMKKEARDLKKKLRAITPV